VPNGLHGRRTRAALNAGKHVLCEKPFTANAAEARDIAELTAKSYRVVMEAFPYRYHPSSLRAQEIIASGELGKLERVEVALCMLLPKFPTSATTTPLPVVRQWISEAMRSTCFTCSEVPPRKSFQHRRNYAVLGWTGP
jgi:Oxidoreductase family, NAD-binding Rossmann fold